MINRSFSKTSTYISRIICGVAVLLLGACSGKLPNFPQFNYPDTGVSNYDLHEIAVPEKNIMQPKSNVTKTVTANNTDSNAAPIVMKVKGLNVDQTYSPNLENIDTRLAKLENVVDDAHHSEVKSPELMATPSEAPMPLDAPVIQKIDTSQTMAGTKSSLAPSENNENIIFKSLNNVRLGTHKDYVRIALDLGGQPVSLINLDNTENLLVVELLNTRPQLTNTDMIIANNPLVESYKVTSSQDGKNQILAMRLKNQTSIIKKMNLAGNTSNTSRIAIDLAL